MQAGGDDGETARREFARELVERRRARSWRAFGMRWDSGAYELVWVLAILATLAAPVIALYGAGFFSLLGIAVGAAIGGAALVGWVLILVMSLRRREVFRRVSGDRTCGSCGYELRNLEVGLAVRVEPGSVRIATGPPRCPECGASWPLMPGPEDEVARTVRRQATGPS